MERSEPGLLEFSESTVVKSVCIRGSPVAGLGDLERESSRDSLEESVVVVGIVTCRRILGDVGWNEARSADGSHLAESVANVLEMDGREALQQASWSAGAGDHVLCLEVEAGLGTLAASADLGQRVAGSWLVASDLEEADVSVVARLGVFGSCGALGDVHHVALEAVDIGLVGGCGGHSGGGGSDSSGGSSEVSRLVLVSDGFVVDGGRVGGGVGGGGGVLVVEVVAEPGVVAAVSAVVEVSVEAVRVVRSEGVGRVSEGESSRVISGVDDGVVVLLRLGEGDGGGKKLHGCGG